MNWYVAEPLLYNVAGSSPSERAVQCCHYLVTAEDHDLAYEKSMVMGNQLSTGDRRFAGLSDLLLVHETPADGAELLWTQTEMTPAELDNEVQLKQQMRAFLGKQSSLSGWYVAQVMLYEVHDEGSHGPNQSERCRNRLSQGTAGR